LFLVRISSLNLRTKKSRSLLQLCVLRAAGMRESRVGVRILGRLPHAGLRALADVPAGGISLRITHPHAAARQAYFRTMAIAAAPGNSSQQCRCVGANGERADQESRC
jgi:hypothetical protein